MSATVRPPEGGALSQGWLYTASPLGRREAALRETPPSPPGEVVAQRPEGSPAIASAVLRLSVLLALAPMLAGCENSATAYSVDGAQHALILVREKPYFWQSTVNQYLVASRLPSCQRRVAIHPGSDTLADMAVFQAGNLLWAVHQSGRWYLAGTEECRVEDWNNPGDAPPGPLVGTFTLKDGVPAFVPAGG